jgi:16S rRNA (cytosine967-C5)-methyltransferase
MARRNTQSPRQRSSSSRRPSAGGRAIVPTRGKSIPALAGLIATLAPASLRDVVEKEKRLEASLASSHESMRGLARADRRLIHRALSSLVRWWGWIEPLKLVHVEDQLLLAWLLDSPDVPAVCRFWANKSMRDSERLFSSGDAPNWTARAQGLKRFMEGRTVTADPWMLFPAWLRDELPVPPGDEPPKSRRLAFLHALQTRLPLWVGVRGKPEKQVWNGLRDLGLKPWIHRRLETAAKLDRDTEVGSLEAVQEGVLIVEDLASQAVAKVCDPDPGERWWDVFGGSGMHALDLGAEMSGKGSVVATFDHDAARHAAALRLRKSPFRNISTKLWDGKHVPGKVGTYDGVLIDAPCSGVGVWRRHPEVRWIVRKPRLAELVDRQRQLLELAASAVRPGGVVVYTVATVTLCETQGVVTSFLADHPEFQLDPFPNPLEEGTTTGSLQIWPQIHDCEARFAARLIRTRSK